MTLQELITRHDQGKAQIAALEQERAERVREIDAKIAQAKRDLGWVGHRIKNALGIGEAGKKPRPTPKRNRKDSILARMLPGVPAHLSGLAEAEECSVEAVEQMMLKLMRTGRVKRVAPGWYQIADAGAPAPANNAQAG